MRQRFIQMRNAAKRSGKAVPTFRLLERLAAALVAMKCPACQSPMNWLLKNGAATVVTLQHDRSGRMRLICKGCNSRHHLHPGDTYYEMPSGHKRCPRCTKTKPIADFGKKRSQCRKCEAEVSLERYRADKPTWKARKKAWLKANRRKASEYERLRRQRKKEAAHA